MSVNIMQTISVVAFVLAGIFAVVALILWFTLGVRGIIDDLSGKKAERQIRELREQNVQSQMAERKNRVVYTPLSGKTASNQKNGRQIGKTSQLTIPLAVHKAESGYFKEEKTALLQEESITVLADAREGTTVLTDAGEGTIILTDEAGTTVPCAGEVMLQNGYRLVLDEIVIHTKEEICII